METHVSNPKLIFGLLVCLLVAWSVYIVWTHWGYKASPKKSSGLNSLIETFRDHIVENKSKLGKKTKYGIVLKPIYKPLWSFNLGYLAKQLEHKVDYMFFGKLHDAVTARLLGCKKPICVLYYINSQDAKLAAKHNIEVIVPSIEWIKEVSKQNIKKLKVHLWYNTGLNKEGVNTIHEVVKMYNYILGQKWCKIIGVGSKNQISLRMSPKMNQESIKRITIANCAKFAELKSVLTNLKNWDPKIKFHFASSYELHNGITNSYFDLVRVGHINYSPATITLKPVQTKILDIANIGYRDKDIPSVMQKVSMAPNYFGKNVITNVPKIKNDTPLILQYQTKDIIQTTK